MFRMADVIVVEIWFQVTQANATARATSFMFDGANVYTDNQESPNGTAAGYIETPETLNFTAPVATRLYLHAANSAVVGTLPRY